MLLGRVAEPAQVELYPAAVRDHDDAGTLGAGGHFLSVTVRGHMRDLRVDVQLHAGVPRGVLQPVRQRQVRLMPLGRLRSPQ